MTIGCDTMEVCPDCNTTNYVSLAILITKEEDSKVRFRYRCEKCRKVHEVYRFLFKGEEAC